jgi:hypothetical protein
MEFHVCAPVGSGIPYARDIKSYTYHNNLDVDMLVTRSIAQNANLLCHGDLTPWIRALESPLHAVKVRRHFYPLRRLLAICNITYRNDDYTLLLP